MLSYVLDMWHSTCLSDMSLCCHMYLTCGIVLTCLSDMSFIFDMWHSTHMFIWYVILLSYVLTFIWHVILLSYVLDIWHSNTCLSDMSFCCHMYLACGILLTCLSDMSFCCHMYLSELVIVVQRQLWNVPAISCWEEVNFLWNDDEVHFVLDQHA